MKAILAMTIALVASATLTAADPSDPTTYVSMFENFKTTHKRQYKDAKEEARRFRIFSENMKTAAAMMTRNPHAKFGVNEYADMSAHEFKSRHNGEATFNAMQEKRKVNVPEYTKAQIDSATSADWVKKGAVTYIKNQGQCGSCWSFSTTGNIEGQWFLAGHTLTALSEQELVSCDTTDHGCQGGLMDNAFNWLVDNKQGWITGEQDYPYVSGMGQVPACSMAGKPNRAQISGHHDLPHNEDQMAAYLAEHGPVSIGVDATSWQTYNGGVMTDCVSTQVDHGVLAVGFDKSASPPYWIIKNSWGPSWGEQGYIRVQFGTDQCLLTSGPTSSIVGNSPVPPPGPPGPVPPPPPPPGPVPPPPGPSGATFTQSVCPDWTCMDSCQTHTFPQKQCLRVSGGGSALASCSIFGLTMDIYSESSDCTGASQSSTDPVDQCLQDQSGTYVYYSCSSGSDRAKKALPYDGKRELMTNKVVGDKIKYLRKVAAEKKH